MDNKLTDAQKLIAEAEKRITETREQQKQTQCLEHAKDTVQKSNQV